MPAIDHFADHARDETGPLNSAFTIIADDSEFAIVTRAIMVSAPGDLAVQMLSGDTITIPGLIPGVIYPLRLSTVFAVGTTAGGIVGLY